jgi:hypothetical protein
VGIITNLQIAFFAHFFYLIIFYFVLCIRVLQRNRINRICVCLNTHLEAYYKKLAHAFIEIGRAVCIVVLRFQHESWQVEISSVFLFCSGLQLSG